MRSGGPLQALPRELAKAGVCLAHGRRLNRGDADAVLVGRGMARLPPPLRRLVARAQLGVLPQQPGALQPHADGQVLGVTAVAALRHRAVGEGQLEDDQAELREVC